MLDTAQEKHTAKSEEFLMPKDFQLPTEAMNKIDGLEKKEKKEEMGVIAETKEELNELEEKVPQQVA